MQQFPEVVDLTTTPDALAGHVWLFESVTGLPLRVQMEADGQLRFGDERRPLDTAAVPVALRPAVRAVRTQFRRDALRAAVDDVTSVTVFGTATCYRGLDYDWDRLPPFVVTDVYAAGREGLLTPDATVDSAERLGLTPAPAVRKELRADAFDPSSVEFPSSEWADAPVAGLVAADKHGARGKVDNDAIEAPTDPGFTDPAAAAGALVPETADEEIDRVLDAVVRRNYGRLVAAGIDPDDGDFHGAVAREVGKRQ